MLVRYSSSVGAGAIVTAALIYWMQLMVAADGRAMPQARRFKPVTYAYEPPPAPTPDRRTPPERPEPRDTPPGLTIPFSGPTTGPAVPSGSVTPPEPPSPPGQPTGRSGPWASDGELVLLVRVPPAYPYSALVEGLEGYVIVEFTVTRDGTVDAIRIVESTRPEFEQPAMAAVAKARYRPRVVGGEAVDAPGQRARIAFRLED